MMQVMTGDSWASGVARQIFEDQTNGTTDHSVAFFFITYVCLASMVLLNVVVAVRLRQSNSQRRACATPLGP
jgi:hypothetical protein